MNTRNIVIALVVLVLLALGAVWLFSDKERGTSGQETASTTPVGMMYESGNLLLGQDSATGTGAYLIGFNGHAVYTYDKDTNGVSNCSGQCAAMWPPYLVPDTSALANLQAGVPGKAGTITRADGSLQVTYDGKPLYFYAPDTDTSGPAGNGAGGVWHLVKPVAAQPETESTTAAIGERIFDNDIHITPLTVVSDSRCPTDVQCIQAGAVTITAKLEDGTHSETVTMVVGSPVAFGNKHVTLMTVAPAKNSKMTIKPSDYRFTFSVAYGMGGDAPQ